MKQTVYLFFPEKDFRCCSRPKSSEMSTQNGVRQIPTTHGKDREAYGLQSLHVESLFHRLQDCAEGNNLETDVLLEGLGQRFHQLVVAFEKAHFGKSLYTGVPVRSIRKGVNQIHH